MEVLLDLIDATGTLLHSSSYFQFHVIVNDPDDNAFTDCAISVGPDYIITKYSDYAPLKNAGYKPQPITPEDFIARYLGVYV